MPDLSLTGFNIVCATIGGFITVFGLVSYLFKEKFYMSETLISTVAGIIFSPHAANFIRPEEYAQGSTENLGAITLYFCRLVLGVQLVLAGVQLPSRYLKTEWKSLTLLLGPGMCAMWISTSLLVWALVPNINFLFALAIGSCVTPTDPVLSNNIVKGKFADRNIPSALQKIVVAESGANDGLGYPFLFFALYLIKYTGDSGLGAEGGAGKAMALWFYDTWAYTILLSVAYGTAVGYVAKELLHWAEERRYVDRESFLVFAITLALFITGTVGMLGSDDVLACFIAGNVFTWDDWFRLETMDDSLQPTIDMLLNVSIFMWFGAVCPWHKFVANDVIPIYRLIPLGVLVLILRRLPMVLAMHKYIHQIEDIRHALFVGFFGPIGVSAIFYVYITLDYLRTIQVNGQEREDVVRLGEAVEIVTWFLVVCSIFVHGLSIPLGKLGLYLPRTISTALSSERVSATTSQARPDASESEGNLYSNSPRPGRSVYIGARSEDISSGERGGTILSALSKFGKTLLRDIKRPHDTTVHGEPDGYHQREQQQAPNDAGSEAYSKVSDASAGGFPHISAPRDPRPMGHAIASTPQVPDEPNSQGTTTSASGAVTPTSAADVSAWQRRVKFGDE